MFPQIKDDLIVQTVDAQETLVCDPVSGRVHLLTPVPYFVFQACKARLDSDGLKELFAESGHDFDESEVAQALAQLVQAGLVSDGAPGEASSSDALREIGRRSFLKAAGVTAVLASVAIPKPVHAATCGGLTGDPDCRSLFGNCGIVSQECDCNLGQVCMTTYQIENTTTGTGRNCPPGLDCIVPESFALFGPSVSCRTPGSSANVVEDCVASRIAGQAQPMNKTYACSQPTSTQTSATIVGCS